MGLYRYTDENKCYREVEDKKEVEKDDDKKEKKEYCDSESARALKKILSLLDDLNNEDLRVLQEVIERLLCSRS
jgi:hypothetical protein